MQVSPCCCFPVKLFYGAAETNTPFGSSWGSGCLSSHSQPVAGGEILISAAEEEITPGGWLLEHNKPLLEEQVWPLCYSLHTLLQHPAHGWWDGEQDPPLYFHILFPYTRSTGQHRLLRDFLDGWRVRPCEIKHFFFWMMLPNSEISQLFLSCYHLDLKNSFHSREQWEEVTLQSRAKGGMGRKSTMLGTSTEWP